jgi:hypothetical protein
MYLLAQLWWFLAAACVLGIAFGFVVRKLMLQRRLDAVQRGALAEQRHHAAALAQLADAHVQALAAQATALREQLDQAHDEALAAQLAEQAHALQDAFAQGLQQAHARWVATLQSHAEMQVRAQGALERAAAHIADQAARHHDAQHHSAAGHRAAQAEVAALQQELAQLKCRLEELSAQRDQAGLRIAELQSELGAAQHDQAIAAQHLQARHDQDEALTRAQQEAALLREQLDVALIELSAAARARDAREAQRAQLAQQLALAQDVRSREARIAVEQREQLMQRLMALRHGAQGQGEREAQLEAQREELMEQLAASRRTTQAAVLAGHQREARLAAELADLRGELDAVRRAAAAGGSATTSTTTPALRAVTAVKEAAT